MQGIIFYSVLLLKKKTTTKLISQPTGESGTISSKYYSGYWLNRIMLCDSMARLFCPWNFPGKNTGAG